LVGTKYDHFNTFSADEQEEITRQVCFVPFTKLSLALQQDVILMLNRIDHTAGQEVFKSDESTSDLLLDFSLYQRSKDFQNRSLKGELRSDAQSHFSARVVD